MSSSGSYVLTLDCPDRPGIVHAVSGFLFEQGGNITESQQYDDEAANRFFMRVQFDATTSADVLRAAFTAPANRLDMTWKLWDRAIRPKTILMVSRAGHCLNDLLFRWSIGSLPVDIVAVVSNHADLEPMAKAHGVPYHHIPVTPDSKSEAEQKLLGLVAETDVDLVVLARYMQVLSTELCEQMSGQIINIHHSFLPSFKGAKPYHQAYERGVKLVGATAHFVTADLDEGPIIEQDVTRVDHSASAEDFVAAGRDVECQVLARAVHWHAESRVFLNGNRAVVFR